MAKDMSRLLQKGNLTPKERHFLRVANFVSKEKTGKSILTETDEYALIDGWQPTNNDEIREFNRYNQAWKTAMFAESDAQTTYLQAKLKYQSMQGLLNSFMLNPFYSEARRALEGLEKIKRVEAKEAINIINRQQEEKLKRGQDINYTIKDLAFELADKETQEKLNGLYDDVDLYEFLDEVEGLIALYDKKDFETIAERVAQKGHRTLYIDYACIPTLEIARRYAKENSLPFEECILSDEDKELAEYSRHKELKEKHPDKYKELELDEDILQPDKVEGELKAIEELAKTLEKHAQEKKTTVEEIIKTACLKWIGEGLLENGDTAITQEERELITKWAENKKKASEVLRGLINKGTLKTGKAEQRGYYGGEAGEEIITGESLYNSGLDYAFIKEFKAYADEYSPEAGLVKGEGEETIDSELLIAGEGFISRHKVLLHKAINALSLLSIVQEKDEAGGVIVDIESKKLKTFLMDMRDDFVKNYELLLGFEEFFKRLSRAYDMDLSYRISSWTADLKDLVESFNNTLLDALKTRLPYSTEKKKHYKSDELFIDTKKIKPNRGRVEPAFKEAGEVFGDAFNE